MRAAAVPARGSGGVGGGGVDAPLPAGRRRSVLIKGTISSAPHSLFEKRERAAAGPREKPFAEQGKFHFPLFSISPFAARRVPLRLSPRSPLTFSAKRRDTVDHPCHLCPARAARSGAESAVRGAGRHVYRRKMISLMEEGRTCPTGKSALFFWTVHGPFSFRQGEKKMGGGAVSPNGGGTTFLRGAPPEGAEHVLLQKEEKGPSPL